MAENPDTVRSVTIIRIADGAVFSEVSLAPEGEAYFEKARSVIDQLKEFDKKRKDHGKIELQGGNLHYEIDSESIGHVLYTSPDYPEKAARAFLKELVVCFEKTVESPEDVDPQSVKKRMSGPSRDLLSKYRVAPEVSEAPTTSSAQSLGLKVDQAKDKVSKQLQQAAANEQDLQMIDEKGKRTKLMAAEMEYETESFNDTMTWRNRKLMIIGGIVGVGLVLAIVIAVVK